MTRVYELLYVSGVIMDVLDSIKFSKERTKVRYSKGLPSNVGT